MLTDGAADCPALQKAAAPRACGASIKGCAASWPSGGSKGA
jgi:hypothetical protein